MKKRYTLDDVREAVKNNHSIAGVLKSIGLRPIGGNYKTIKTIISDNNIDINHFTGQGWNIGLQFNPKRIITDEEIFIEHSKYLCSWRLRERYKKKLGLNHCQSCGRYEWLDKPIPLEIHHKNGDNRDNRLENLILLCPNCHALTDSYRGRTKRKSK